MVKMCFVLYEMILFGKSKAKFHIGADCTFTMMLKIMCACTRVCVRPRACMCV